MRERYIRGDETQPQQTIEFRVGVRTYIEAPGKYKNIARIVYDNKTDGSNDTTNSGLYELKESEIFGTGAIFGSLKIVKKEKDSNELLQRV